MIVRPHRAGPPPIVRRWPSSRFEWWAWLGPDRDIPPNCDVEEREERIIDELTVTPILPCNFEFRDEFFGTYLRIPNRRLE